MRRTPRWSVWGFGLALLAGGALGTWASAQGTVKGASGIRNGPVGAEKAGTAKPGVPEKRISFSMSKKPWQGAGGVLNWLSDQLELPLVATKSPTGSFTFTPPVVNGVAQTYTLPEVVDLINQQLQRENWILIRYRDHFTVLPADAELPAFPRVELDELAQRGGSEVVSLVYPIKKVSAVEAGAEVQKLLGQPFGKVLVLESSNRLILQDTVHSLRQIAETIQLIEGGSDAGRHTVLHHTCLYRQASAAADHLKQLLGDEKEEVMTITPKGERKLQHRVVKVSVDEASNSVLVSGPAEKLASAREILRRFDTGTEKVAVGQPSLKMYSVSGGNAEAISKILQEAYKSSAGLKVAAVNSTTVAVWAGPEMQIRIARELMADKDDKGLTSKAEFIPLTVSKASYMASFLQYAFPTEKGKTGGPVIDYDSARNGILVYGTEQQVAEVRKTIVTLEGQDSSSSGMAVIDLERGSAEVLAEALKAILESAQPGREVKVIVPGRDLVKPEREKKPEPEKKPAPPKQSQKTGRASSPISDEETWQARQVCQVQGTPLGWHTLCNELTPNHRGGCAEGHKGTPHANDPGARPLAARC